MQNESSLQIIAERKLYLRGDAAEKVLVKIFLPRVNEYQSYSCDGTIENLLTGKTKKFSAGGADSTQALIIGICMAGLELAIFNKQEFNSMLVIAPGYPAPDGKLGFPLYDSKLDKTVFF